MFAKKGHGKVSTFFIFKRPPIPGSRTSACNGHDQINKQRHPISESIVIYNINT